MALNVSALSNAIFNKLFLNHSRRVAANNHFHILVHRVKAARSHDVLLAHTSCLLEEWKSRKLSAKVEKIYEEQNTSRWLSINQYNRSVFFCSLIFTAETLRRNEFFYSLCFVQSIVEIGVLWKTQSERNGMHFPFSTLDSMGFCSLLFTSTIYFNTSFLSPEFCSTDHRKRQNFFTRKKTFN